MLSCRRRRLQGLSLASLSVGADRLPSKAPQCDVNGRWAQVVTWEEAKGAMHSQGIQGAHREMVDLRVTGNSYSESVVLFCV